MSQPFAEKGFDLVLVEVIADALGSRHVLTPRDAIVQSLIIDTAVLKLALQRRVTIDTKLGRIGEIGAELIKNGPKSSSRP